MTDNFLLQPKTVNKGNLHYSLYALFALCCLLLTQSAFATAVPNWQWGDNFGGDSAHSNLVDLDTDAQGNTVALIKMVGWYKVDGNWVTSQASWDPLLIKYDSQGNVLWTRVLRGHHQEVPTALDIDNNGDIVLVGTFNHSWDLDGINRSAHHWARNAFVIKVSGSNGGTMWFNHMYGHENGFATATDVTVDSANNVYLHGVFTHDLYINRSRVYRSNQYYNHYFASFGSGGGLRWSSVETGGSTYEGAMLTAGPNDELFVGRNRDGAFKRAFIGRMNPNNGGFMWQYEMYASRDISIADVVADNAGNVHLFGKHVGGIHVNGTSIGGTGSYYVKLQGNGSVERLHVPVWQSGRKLRFDQDNNLHVLGVFDGASFNLGGFQMYGNPHGSQMFVAKLTPDHQVTWAREGGAPGAPHGIVGLGLDALGSVYVGSDQSGMSNFGDISLNREWNYTSLVAKLGLDEEEEPSHDIDASSGPNGTISPSGTVKVDEGEDQDFVITPAFGYHILDVIVDETSVGPVSQYTFEDVDSDHTIEAIFEINSYTVNISKQGNGTVDPTGEVTVTHGSNQTITIEAAQYHIIEEVYIDGVAQGAMNSVLLSDIQSNRSVHVVFGQTTAGAIQQLRDAVAGLPAGVWPNPNRSRALLNQIDEAYSMYESGDLQGAIDMLSTPIMMRTDGCSRTGSVDRTDWIKDCASQGVIEPLVRNLINLISAEL